MADPVKGKTEAGRRREERARQTRHRIVDAGMRLFIERGYSATTVEAIAREAGVAAATIYQAFGTKHAILARALDVTIAGDDAPLALLEQEWVDGVTGAADPVRRLEAVVRHAAGVAIRTAPIKEVMRDAAATEPAVRDLISQDHQRRRRTQRALVDLVAGDGRGPRTVLDREAAAATFFALVNSHSYLVLHEELGWDAAEWTGWLLGVLQRELLGRPG